MLFITFVPKVLSYGFLIRRLNFGDFYGIFIGWVIKLSVQTFQSFIVICITEWVILCIISKDVHLYRTSYPFISLRSNAPQNWNKVLGTSKLYSNPLKISKSTEKITLPWVFRNLGVTFKQFIGHNNIFWRRKVKINHLFVTDLFMTMFFLK